MHERWTDRNLQVRKCPAGGARSQAFPGGDGGGSAEEAEGEAPRPGPARQHEGRELASYCSYTICRYSLLSARFTLGE